MRGVKKVALFCVLTTLLPTLLLVVPLYLRHSLFADVVYAVAESDIMEIEDGISTIFCSEHTLKMNSSFNAFQVSQRPEITSYRKHIRLKKSMILPDDTLEYWGFYLLRGATVALSVCSRFQGASILVVKGERNLRTCGMMEHNSNKALDRGTYLPLADQQVKVTFESNAQEVNSQQEPIAVSNVNRQRTHHKITETPDAAVSKSERGNVQRSTNDTDTDSHEPIDEERLKSLIETAESYIQKHKEEEGGGEETETTKPRHVKKGMHRVNVEKDDKGQEEMQRNENKLNANSDPESYNSEEQVDERIRRQKRGLNHRGVRSLVERRKLVKRLEEELNSAPDEGGEQLEEYGRTRRSIDSNPYLILDRGVEHGGNAGNFTGSDESSVSSFEDGLLSCYDGQVLLKQEFAPSELCTNVSYLVNGKHMQTRHDVAEDGYYYYIFYSDNDFVSNDIHAVFDIYKPTFQYENVSKACINQTECSFSIKLLSGDRVIVEVPTRDGIEHKEDDITFLSSTCHPRMGIYVIFPVAVLFFVLGCAFL